MTKNQDQLPRWEQIDNKIRMHLICFFSFSKDEFIEELEKLMRERDKAYAER